MELKYLYTVKKILETGNYQKAAQALNYAQSTITFQMKQLESELSVKLFVKEGNKMVLTSQGRDLMPYINQVIDASENLLQVSQQKQSNDEIGGSLTIAIPESLMTYQIPAVLKKFKETAPKVKLNLKVMNCYDIYDQMVNGNIDLGLHYEVKQYPSRINTHRLDTYPLVLVASPGLNEEYYDFTTANQVKSICHIQNDPNALFLKKFNQYLKLKNIQLAPEMVLWSIESIKQSVMSKLGIAFLPRFTVEEELAQGLLKEIPIDMADSYLTATYAYSESKLTNPALRLFLEILQEHFSASVTSNILSFAQK